MAELKAWKEEHTPLKDRILKAAVCTLLFGLFIGIFIGVAIHFGKESVDDKSGGSGNMAAMSAGSGFGISR